MTRQEKLDAIREKYAVLTNPAIDAADLFSLWKPRLSLEDQSDPCINFLFDLLCV